MDECVVFYLIRFADGDEPLAEGQVMHVGDKESCELVAELLPAVSYAGDRTIDSAVMFVRPQADPPLKPGELIHVTGSLYRARAPANRTSTQ